MGQLKMILMDIEDLHYQGFSVADIAKYIHWDIDDVQEIVNQLVDGEQRDLDQLVYDVQSDYVNAMNAAMHGSTE